jgi:hypothetical protein
MHCIAAKNAGRKRFGQVENSFRNLNSSSFSDVKFLSNLD